MLSLHIPGSSEVVKDAFLLQLTRPDTMSMMKSAGFSSSGITNPRWAKYLVTWFFGPVYTTNPPFISTWVWLKRWKMDDLGWWIEAMMVMPDPVKKLRHLSTLSAETASSPVVGSSRTRHSGHPASSRPMLTLRHSPPEIPPFSGVPTIEFRIEKSPSRLRIWSVRAFLSLTNLFLSFTLNRMFSLTVRFG